MCATRLPSKFCNNQAPEDGRMKPLRFLFFCWLLICMMSAVLGAQSPAASSEPSSSTQSQAAPAASTIVEYAPPPAEYARAKAYSNAHYRHVFIGAFYGFLVLLVILRWRVAPSFRSLAERVS